MQRVFFSLSKQFSHAQKRTDRSSHPPVTWLAAGYGSLFGALLHILEINLFDIFSYMLTGNYNKFIAIIYSRKLNINCASSSKKIFLSIRLREMIKKQMLACVGFLFLLSFLG